MTIFERGLRHPFYPSLKLAPAARAKRRCPALTGTYRELFAAAAVGVEAERAVFPLHRPSSPFLDDEERDALWTLFRVPVIAILLDGRGDVAGYECELQHGFHLADGYPADLLFGALETDTCDCGRPGPRLMRVPSKNGGSVQLAALRDGAGAGVR